MNAAVDPALDAEEPLVDFNAANRRTVGEALGSIIAVIMIHHIKNMNSAYQNDHSICISMEWPTFAELKKV